MNEKLKKPNILLYSLTLPFFWFSLGFFMDYFFTGKRLGSLGFIIIIFAAITLICWHLSRNFGRNFMKSEKVKLIIYLTILAVICEFLGIWYNLSLESTPKMGASTLSLILAFTAATDALLISLGVHFIGKRMCNYFLSKDEQANT